ncbi:glycoside hydrolase family 5 protein [Botryobasidium botryosum FD-172 SS1]|uniref:glucan 1,3-beta-glucosidase n=1 Tax=Botryobasidium botryosum (strain FD-172 SS1) TaxID=930990 RepID=A0A067ML25_BOTB1|nr:glycoside hydrolase family 5 protein [Botryobasidium botryosum FD-172 SS1]
MRTTTLVALAAILFSTLSSTALARPFVERGSGPTLRFPYGATKVRGVNLGGWLVLEPWITPSLFDNTGNDKIVDEYTFGQLQDKATAQATLQQHWDTWITEKDFQDIAAAGLNHVRLPIGYWAFDVSGGEPYIQGQKEYLYKAAEWAGKHGIKVWVDLHGAPGSQNGFDNSGRRGDALWHTEAQNVARTSAIIKLLAAEFSKDKYANSVSAIAALNEPAGFISKALLDTATQYWYDSYGNTRYPFGNSTQGDLLLVIHDAFQPLTHWNGFMPVSKGFQGVALDTHYYQVFDNGELQWTYDQHIQNACARGKEIAAYSASNLWTIAGEWTTAPTDCAKYLNGRGVGARYDGTYPGSTPIGSCSNVTGSKDGFSDAYKAFLRKFWEAQTTAFEGSQGWIMWTWKAENADDWSYQTGLAGGWIPSDPTERMYPNVCN